MTRAGAMARAGARAGGWGWGWGWGHTWSEHLGRLSQVRGPDFAAVGGERGEALLRAVEGAHGEEARRALGERHVLRV